MTMTHVDAIGIAAEGRHAPRSDGYKAARSMTRPAFRRAPQPALRNLAADHAMSAVCPSSLVTANQHHAARMIATALALTSHEGLRAYAALRSVLTRRLTSSERQGLAWAALGACSPDQARGIAADLFEIEEQGGPPPSPFDPDDATSEAQLWAEGASPSERLAYGLAIFQRLSADERHRVMRAGIRDQPE